MTSQTMASFGATAVIPPTPGFPELYERFLVGPIFAPWAQRIVERLDLRTGSALLDVACGTGIVARVARDRAMRAIRIVGVDRNPGMLAVAREMAPGVEWREGDAAALPVGADERFDAVCCQQGLQFVADKAGAVAEMRRVLAPGGIVAIAVWRALEENGVFEDLGRIAERFVGPIADARHAFGDEDALERLLTGGGFLDVRVEALSQDMRVEYDPTVLARLNAMAVIGMSANGKAMAEEERVKVATTIVEASGEVLARYARKGGLTSKLSANVATGGT